MGLQAIYPKKRPFKVGSPLPRKYPRLLKNVVIARPDQAWCLTYLRMQRGFAYLMAVMDCFSRPVLSWRLSNTQDRETCLELYRKALLAYRAPEIFHTDQGSQYTGEAIPSLSLRSGIKISMTGRCYDNILIECLWRSAKYEEVYFHEYVDMRQAKKRLESYVAFYNGVRLHQALNNQIPQEVYYALGRPRQQEQSLLAHTTICPLGQYCPVITHNHGSLVSYWYLNFREKLSNDWGTPHFVSFRWCACDREKSNNRVFGRVLCC